MWDEAILWKWSAPLVAAGFGLLLLVVYCAGSFNPPHNGHLAMLLYLVERYVRFCFESSFVGWSHVPESCHFLTQADPKPTHYRESYGDVIVVVGMNPTKQYLVSPEQRASLIRRMLEPHAGASKHVRVEGANEKAIESIRSWHY